MKTLIVCASKYGATENAAKMLLGKIDGDVECINLKKKAVNSIEGFDRVVIGTSIYAGNAHKEMIEFVNGNRVELEEKEIAFFVCCGFEAKAEAYLRENFSDDLIDKAMFVKYFGQEVVLKDMKFLEKSVYKIVSKSKEDIHDIREDAIDEAAEILGRK